MVLAIGAEVGFGGKYLVQRLVPDFEDEQIAGIRDAEICHVAHLAGLIIENPSAGRICCYIQHSDEVGVSGGPFANEVAAYVSRLDSVKDVGRRDGTHIAIGNAAVREGR